MTDFWMSTARALEKSVRAARKKLKSLMAKSVSRLGENNCLRMLCRGVVAGATSETEATMEG